MPLIATLVRGAATGLGKRPSPDAALPDVTLTEPAARIDPARVAAYAEVCGYRADGPELPLTYPHILGFPLAARIMAARSFPLPLLGLVHTSIDIVRHEPLAVGDRPELTVRAERLRPHRRGTEVEVVTRARLGGRLAWEDRSTYLARHARTADAGRDAEPGPEPAPASGPGRDEEPGRGGEPAGGPGGDAEPAVSGGPVPRREEWRLPADLGRRHARVSGDYNPIHLHPLTARPLGFPRAIAHGMWTVARCAAASPRRVTRLTAEFRRPVLLPATVEYAADGARFEVRSPAGLHLTGTREFEAP